MIHRKQYVIKQSCARFIEYGKQKELCKNTYIFIKTQVSYVDYLTLLCASNSVVQCNFG